MLRRLQQHADFGNSRHGERLFLMDGGHLAIVQLERSLARGEFRERLRQRDEGHRTPHAALDLAGRFRTREDARQSVVILERDRIKLMIVAAGAMQRHPQKAWPATLMNATRHDTRATGHPISFPAPPPIGTRIIYWRGIEATLVAVSASGGATASPPPTCAGCGRMGGPACPGCAALA